MRVGDLIRSDATGDFINIVLEITPISEELTTYWGKKIPPQGYYYVRSVRYGNTNHGDFKYLNGQRSKLFVVPSINLTNWEIVDEYAAVDNQLLRANILEAMRDVDTSYKTPKCEDEDE
jgi:hypothetical protein